jgi:hypothetical protein
VDLKQKQSDVLDARSARIQAEESLKVTKENERQGKTMKVFTVVTIIFVGSIVYTIRNERLIETVASIFLGYILRHQYRSVSSRRRWISGSRIRVRIKAIIAWSHDINA